MLLTAQGGDDEDMTSSLDSFPPHTPWRKQNMLSELPTAATPICLLLLLLFFPIVEPLSSCSSAYSCRSSLPLSFLAFRSVRCCRLGNRHLRYDRATLVRPAHSCYREDAAAAQRYAWQVPAGGPGAQRLSPRGTPVVRHDSGVGRCIHQRRFFAISRARKAPKGNFSQIF